MTHSALAPVFTGLRLGLHILLFGLTGIAVVRAFITASSFAWWTLTVGLAFVVVYALGAWGGNRFLRGVASRTSALVWVGALTLLWACVLWVSPDGAYLVFPLFFLYLHVLPGVSGVIAVVVTTAFSILALGLHTGASVGGFLGPLIGAGVALLLGLAYRALRREAAERERLLTELMRTQDQLAETERTQGALAERSRLARDIHDTVA